MITLYHGSYISVSSPQVDKGRKNVDFGQGFYLTKIRLQAEKWARIMKLRKGPQTSAAVSVFEFDAEKAKADGVRYKEFLKYDIDWLDYVVDCRKGGEMQKLYDIVEGGVANDNVIDTIEDYENGRLTAEQALGQLKYKEVNHQLCIHSQKIVDVYLKYMETIELQEDEL